MSKLRVDKIAAAGVSTETTGSVFFDGTDDFMGLDGSSDFAFGTGDFAIEFWVYFNAGSFSDNSVDPNLIDFRPFNTQGAYPTIFYDTSSNNLRYYVDSGNRIDGGQLSDQTWYHIALEREGTSTKMYVNGSQVGSTYSDSNDYVVGTNRPVIACQGHNPDSNDRRLDGYISNLRICKGHAVYKSNFTPPTKELDVHPQSVLLVCYDGENIFADKTGRHIITAYGDRVSGIGTAAQSPIGITTIQPGLIRDVDPTAGPTFQGGVRYNSQNWLTLPKGTTAERNQTGGRGLFGGGNPGAYSNVINYVTISSMGNSLDFGDLTEARSRLSSYGSKTRGIWAGGNPYTNTIDFVHIATTGDAVNFGDLTVARRFLAGTSSSTRGISAGGNTPGGSPFPSNSRIDYTTIATLGDAQTFGELAAAKSGLAALSSPTRALFAGGYSNGLPAAATVNITQVEISTLGDSTNFGDLTVSGRRHISGCSSNTRGVFGSGSAPGQLNTIDYVTIATAGDAVDFGDATISNEHRAAMSNSIRGLWAGHGTPAAGNTIDYVTIATTGNASDFGDCESNTAYAAGCSDSHGGIS